MQETPLGMPICVVAVVKMNLADTNKIVVSIREVGILNDDAHVHHQLVIVCQTPVEPPQGVLDVCALPEA